MNSDLVIASVLISCLFVIPAWVIVKTVREHLAWKRKHDEDVRVFEFWKARCADAWQAYDEATEAEKDAKWRAYLQTIERYRVEVVAPIMETNRK